MEQKSSIYYVKQRYDNSCLFCHQMIENKISGSITKSKLDKFIRWSKKCIETIPSNKVHRNAIKMETFWISLTLLRVFFCKRPWEFLPFPVYLAPSIIKLWGQKIPRLFSTIWRWDFIRWHFWLLLKFWRIEFVIVPNFDFSNRHLFWGTMSYIRIFNSIWNLASFISVHFRNDTAVKMILFSAT